MYDGGNLKNWADKLHEILGQKDGRIVIYGTGNGGRIAYDALVRCGRKSKFVGFIENDNFELNGRCFQGNPIRHLSDIYSDIDTVIIGAIQSHQIIQKRLESFKKEHCNANFHIVNLFAYNTFAEEREYLRYVERMLLKKAQETFVQISPHPFQRQEGDPKVIAWYLPQFHQIPVNNEFLGKGFTEWTNTTQTLPVFTGHYQPHIPYDVGYYDLNNIEVFKRQIELATHYGIYGFCFHYYWFSGTRLMEKPLLTFLDNSDLDIKFCLNWANENWTSLWDGGDNRIIYRQTLQDGDCDKFVRDLMPIISDRRYIRIDGRPLLIIYRANMWPKESTIDFLGELRMRIKRSFGNDLYILLTNARGFDENVVEWGADAIVEFPPHAIGNLMKAYRPEGYVNPYFVGNVIDGTSFIENRRYMISHNSKTYYRSALTSWDNTARKATTNATIYTGFTPDTFRKWLMDIMAESRQIHRQEENYVFVNSWNEWAEGSHLEPDLKFGYAYLQAVKDSLERSRVQ